MWAYASMINDKILWVNVTSENFNEKSNIRRKMA